MQPIEDFFDIPRKKKDQFSYEAIDENRQDTDHDSLNDNMEQSVGLHDKQNRPLHRLGPNTPGPAKVRRNGIDFPYDDSIISLSVKPRDRTCGKYSMPTPKKMKLSINMGGNHDQSGFKINMGTTSPHKHTLNDSKIKTIGISKAVNPVSAIKKSASKNKNEIGNLSFRLSGFITGQKRSSSVSLSSADRLDFSHVGIVKRNKKVIP